MKNQSNSIKTIAIAILFILSGSALASLYAGWATTTAIAQHDSRSSTQLTIVTVGDCEYVVASSLYYRDNPSVALVHHTNCRYCKNRNTLSK